VGIPQSLILSPSLSLHALPLSPSVHPFAQLGTIADQFNLRVQHTMAVAAAVAAGGAAPAAVVAPLFDQPAAPLVLEILDQNLLQPAARYFGALQHVAANVAQLANPDDSIQRIPVDGLFRIAHSAAGVINRFEVLAAAQFGVHQAPAVDVIMRRTALNVFTQGVDQFVLERAVPSLAAAAAIGRDQVNVMPNRLLVVGPQGMGKSFCTFRDVSLKRSVATNRVLFFPHCDRWLNSDYVSYLLEVVMIAFQADPPVLAACIQVQGIIVQGANAAANAANERPIAHLLAFAAMYCFLNGLRMYVYADQLNALIARSHAGAALVDNGAMFPFSILRSFAIPYWHFLAVVIVTVVSSNNDIEDEVSSLRAAPTHYVSALTDFVILT
jgi:hypothetical protein